MLLRNVLGYMKGLEWAASDSRSPWTVERVFLKPVGGDEDNRDSDANFATAADMIDGRLRARLPIKAGPHEIGVAFLRKNSSETAEPLELHSVRSRSAEHERQPADRSRGYYRALFRRRAPGDTPSGSASSSASRLTAAEQTACARRILSTLARRAYRGLLPTRTWTR